jgi:dissimilatory sulfite reductase related protein
MQTEAGTQADTDQPAPHFCVVAGRRILFDHEGFFWQADDWSADAAEELAREAGIEGLSELQWDVIGFLRSFYFENGRSPLNRKLAAGVNMSLLDLERLFPGGIKYGARRLAGLPNPKNCS